MSKHHAWDKPGARSVSWSDDPCLCKDLMGDSTLRYCPACSGAAPDMAEELGRAKDLIAIYERDRTRHLRLIEGADKDLAELGESLGEEIERLELSIESYEADHQAAERYVGKLEAQRDELLKAATNVEGAMSKIFTLLNAWAKLELPAQDSDYSGIIAQVYGDLAAHHGEIRAAIERATP